MSDIVGSQFTERFIAEGRQHMLFETDPAVIGSSSIT